MYPSESFHFVGQIMLPLVTLTKAQAGEIVTRIEASERRWASAGGNAWSSRSLLCPECWRRLHPSPPSGSGLWSPLAVSFERSRRASRDKRDLDS